MKTFIFASLLLSVSAAGYVYNVHPEWIPKQFQPAVAQENNLPAVQAPVPVTHSASLAPSLPVAAPALITSSATPKLVLATPSPAPVKHWIKPSASTIYPTDWTLADGTTYHKVKVLSVDPDAVQIEHSNGVCLVDCSNLNPDLQKLVNYDPDLATSAAAKRKNEEDQSNQALLIAQMATPSPQPQVQAPTATVTAPQGPSQADLRAQISSLLQQAYQADEAQRAYHQIHNPTDSIVIDAGNSLRRQAAELQRQLR